MPTADFEMYSGDSREQPVAIVDSDGVAVDVSTAAAIVYKIADSVAGSAHVTKTLSSGILVSGGTVTVTLLPADTADLSGWYYHEMQLTDADGHVFTPFAGHIYINRDLIV